MKAKLRVMINTDWPLDRICRHVGDKLLGICEGVSRLSSLNQEALHYCGKPCPIGVGPDLRKIMEAELSSSVYLSAS